MHNESLRCFGRVVTISWLHEAMHSVCIDKSSMFPLTKMTNYAKP